MSKKGSLAGCRLSRLCANRAVALKVLLDHALFEKAVKEAVVITP